MALVEYRALGFSIWGFRALLERCWLPIGLTWCRSFGSEAGFKATGPQMQLILATLRRRNNDQGLKGWKACGSCRGTMLENAAGKFVGRDCVSVRSEHCDGKQDGHKAKSRMLWHHAFQFRHADTVQR